VFAVMKSRRRITALRCAAQLMDIKIGRRVAR